MLFAAGPDSGLCWQCSQLGRRKAYGESLTDASEVGLGVGPQAPVCSAVQMRPQLNLGRSCDTCSSRQFGCGAMLLFLGQVRFGFCQFIGSLRPPGSEALPWVLGFVGKPLFWHLHWAAVCSSETDVGLHSERWKASSLRCHLSAMGRLLASLASMPSSVSQSTVALWLVL